ncbi:UvrB/UvrC motif-containing protein, partial [candidate division WWE3 bacterium]|nr:UvrB/UvrC motif-containing protein [candidate division WWE3 bacterium]
LTKKMAEDLAEFLQEQGLKVTYLHADVETLDRSDILDNLRRGVYDVVVGINLLREGLDLPEVSLVAILEADKEGFLRSETSLVQTMGRAARHVDGKVIMYADTQTGSMKRAIDEINRRRKIQDDYNQAHNITPVSISKPFRDKIIERQETDNLKKQRFKKDLTDIIEVKDAATVNDLIQKLEKEMKKAAKDLDFEKAAYIRDRIQEIQEEGFNH